MSKLLTTTLLFLSIFVNNISAQYYYKDILSNKQLIVDMAVYKAHKLKTIEVNSFEADGQPSKGFFCEKKISKNYRQMETYSRSFVTNKSILTTSFDEKGLLIRSDDSSDVSVSTSDYKYDAAGNILSITSNSRSSDDDFTTSLIEVHQYSYNDKGQLQKMLRIKNNVDTTEIDFTIDAKGNVTDEIEVAVYGNHYYYYYDGLNRLTDIVRYNVVKQKPLPDFIFEYNDDGQLSKMVATQEGVNANYFVWQYVYDGELRIKEKCYSKENDLLGYFEYEYE
jgi:YD repeat-containing protein